MPHVGFPQLLETDILNGLEEAKHARLQADRQGHDLRIDRIERLNGPAHISYIADML